MSSGENSRKCLPAPNSKVGEIWRVEQSYRAFGGNAALDCIEPNLDVQLNAKTGSHIDVEISIMPDNMTKANRFTKHLDQTYLPLIIATCKRILEKLPVWEAGKLALEPPPR